MKSSVKLALFALSMVLILGCDKKPFPEVDGWGPKPALPGSRLDEYQRSLLGSRPSGTSEDLLEVLSLVRGERSQDEDLETFAQVLDREFDVEWVVGSEFKINRK